MKRILIVLAMLAFCLPGAWSGEGKDDGKATDGTWIPVEAELAGLKFPDEVLKKMKLVVNGDKYAVTVGDKIDKGTVKLGLAAKPRSMDITGVEGPNKGKTFLAIYELTGDKLRVCYDLAGKNRPTEFKTAKDTQLFLVTYKRDDQKKDKQPK